MEPPQTDHVTQGIEFVAVQVVLVFTLRQLELQVVLASSVLKKQEAMCRNSCNPVNTLDALQCLRSTLNIFYLVVWIKRVS